jgi:hypothetical protein
MLRAAAPLAEHVRDWSTGPAPYVAEGSGGGKPWAVPYEVHVVTLLVSDLSVPEHEAWDMPMCKALEMIAAGRERAGHGSYVTDESWERYDAQRAKAGAA